MDVAVIGGGAAGFFAAIAVRENHPEARVTIYERSKQLLAKVRISGGGRCNVTNACTDPNQLAQAYPRGGRAMKKILQHFGTADTRTWFEDRGVPLMVQEDERVFPLSQNSQSIIDCFLDQAKILGIQIQVGQGVQALERQGEKWHVNLAGAATEPPTYYDHVIVATGGSPRREGLVWLENLGHTIVDPAPSLFSFNLTDDKITALTGLAVNPVLVAIQGSKLKASGPLLITHWGLSGPAILKLSAFGARELKDCNYEFKLQVNWSAETNQDQVNKTLIALQEAHPQKLLINLRPYGLQVRLWRHLLERAEADPAQTWGALGSRTRNRLVNILSNDVYGVQGKTTFKEEFVTSGGISLTEVTLSTMESKRCKGLYFAGEILDIDGITGGYNFQAAWTTAFIAAKLESAS